MKPIARRTLLQGLGALGSLGALSSFRPARADGAAPARRILFYVTSHGTVHDRWQMTGGASRDTEIDRSLDSLSEQDFSYILRPLHRFRRKLLVIDGLTNYGGMQASFNEHEEGSASCLTAYVPDEVDGSLGVSPGPSFDQVLAPLRRTPIPSLEYSVGGWPVNFDGSGQAIPYEDDPDRAYRRLFPNGDDQGNDEPSVKDRVKRHQSKVLDLAQRRFDALSKNLSSEDRLKLEQHRDLLSDLSNQLTDLAELECDIPNEPGPFPSYFDPEWELEMNRAFFELSRAAFSCAITDVITIRTDNLSNEAIGAPPGDLHNDYAHNVRIDDRAADVMADFHLWHAERFAELCEMLDEVPEEGGTMLDHTLCVWTNELGTGDHLFGRLPIVIAGGTSALASGRYVNFPAEREFEGPWGNDEESGPAHNRLFITLAHALGETGIDRVGETQFRDYDGQNVPATGLLPGILA